MFQNPTVAVTLGVLQRGWTWRSHTGHLARWSPATNTWHGKPPNTDHWQDLTIRECVAPDDRPYVAVGCGGTGTCAIGRADPNCPNCY